MAKLLQNNGSTLEPSCGDGVFLKFLQNYLAIEIDENYAPKNATVMDFFSLPTKEKFDSIIGNPPYVRYQDIGECTKMKLSSMFFDKRTNLYLFFIDKAIDHLKPNGEIVFIVPREFIKSTSSRNLNQKIFDNGTITHLLDLGDSRIFQNAAPNCVIFRYEKNNFNRETKLASCFIGGSKDTSMLEDLNWLSSNFDCRNGQLLFTNNRYPYILKELAEVKVGAVSGADDIFVNKVPGNLDFVYSGTLKNGDLKKMYFPIVKSEAEEILKDYKDVLISRRIKNFTEADWWQWGRGYPLNTKKRVYVNCKTRNPAPFFTSQCSNFDGSVMAIFPRNQSVNLKSFCEDLNNIDWQELGFLCDGRFLFTQRSLENCPLPEYFQKYFI